MFIHIFKIIWKKKRNSRLLMMQFFGSFIICFLVLVVLLKFNDNKKLPLGFSNENVWFLNISSPTMKAEKLSDLYTGIKSTVNSIESIKSYTLVDDNVPYMLRSWTTNVKNEERSVKQVNSFFVDDEFASVLSLNIIEGQWFNLSNNVSIYRPVVINIALKEALYGNKNVIGEQLDCGKNGICIIVGIVDEYRYRGEFSGSKPSCFYRTIRDQKEIAHENKVNASNRDLEPLSGLTILFKTKRNYNFSDQEKLVNKLTRKHSGLNFNLKSLDEMSISNRQRLFIPLIIAAIICIFLIFDLFVGLFGVLWYNINLRKQEIALRISVGAYTYKIFEQIIGEMLILSTLGMLPGILLAIQFPILNVFEIKANLYILAIISSVLLTYLLVIICAIIPSAQAAKIQPAIALHEE